ncbi:anthranilate phosphoribosyltransferase [Candidatus Omnitrophota bacterium]
MSEKTVITQLFKQHGLSKATCTAVFNRIMRDVSRGCNLSERRAKQAMVLLMSGYLHEAHIGLFLVAMHVKGETTQEIAAFAMIMRAFAASVYDPRTKKRVVTIDSCGTGGGTVSTFNISTAVAFVLAAEGLSVAKHGNRAMTSRAGSADVLEACGLNMTLTPHQVGKCIDKVGIGFLFAPHFHKATRFVQPVRKQLTHKTFFNILGPLTNPTAPAYQVIGVYAPQLTAAMAHVLKRLGVKRAMVVHGGSTRKGESLDEISLLGPTIISEVKNKRIRNFTFDPKRYGFRYCKASDLQGGSAKQNATILKRILAGKEKGPKRDIVVINAAAALLVAGRVNGFAHGLQRADELIGTGLPYQKLEELVEYSHKIAK